MPKLSRFGTTLVLMLAISVAGCGSSSTQPRPDLDQAVAMELASELFVVVLTAGFGAFGAPEADLAAGGELPPTLFNTESFSETVACQLGGNITLAGTVTSLISDQGTGTFGMQLAYSPNGCGVNTSQGPFIMNGNPNLSIGANYTVSQWNIQTMTMEMTGGFSWTGGGQSGSCSVNVSYNFNYATSNLQMSGHMCGYQI